MTNIIQPTSNLPKYQLTHLILLFPWLAVVCKILEAFLKLMETLTEVTISAKEVDNLALLIESISDIVHDPSSGYTHKSLNIILCNAEGIKKCKIELQDLINNHSPDL
ncbi:hypothetical protein CDAR_115101 [Caerostris darwini]|uniref:Uncharacterized protein n=1 Tax=Caerostris darwini TaxID=1538125 RepID=A0AAV4U075_9ARAC|nr:hypothetical protein CDAR_115101 [Caerostris darwini]